MSRSLRLTWFALPVAVLVDAAMLLIVSRFRADMERAQGLVWQSGFDLALWVEVAVVMAGCMGRGSRRSPQRSLTVEASAEPRRDRSL